MTTRSVPAGYHSITPTLVVRDAHRAIDFYKQVFGAEEVSRLPGPDGKIMHAELRIGDSMFMLGEENPTWGALSPLSTNGNPGSLHLYVPDADAAYEHALASGCEVRMPIEDAFWGDRYAKVRDPFGHEWGIATRVKDLTEQETMQAFQDWMASAQTQSTTGATA